MGKTKKKNKQRKARVLKDDVTGSYLEFLSGNGELRKIKLLNNKHLKHLLKKYRVDSNYCVSRPDNELDLYPKHLREGILNKFDPSKLDKDETHDFVGEMTDILNSQETRVFCD
ncbi:hypothetical protein [Vibrio mediterranei]|uniref:hypothetical protein n=1 Tax=Vibrio mediterranei TaxID=689 RepID=UPI004068B09B